MTRRTERINELLRAEISELLQREMKDPRLGGLITITEVDVSPDLRTAKVHVSVMGTAEQKDSTFRALRAASRFLQREIRSRITIRRMPDLTFLPDESMERAARILDLIDHTQDE
jgi:ribosome-binding factor A